MLYEYTVTFVLRSGGINSDSRNTYMLLVIWGQVGIMRAPVFSKGTGFIARPGPRKRLRYTGHL
ncbi:hypothetical protein M378DRAFT_173062, partial [Amanita muscaria Koide BX008]